MFKKLLSAVLVGVMIMGMSTTAFAAENVDVLTTTPPQSIEVQPYGANPPSSGADTHDLSVSSYNYQITDFGYKVYTSKWLTGETSFSVSADNWTILDEHGGANNSLTIRVFNSSKKEVASKEITISNGSGSATISGLSASSKYYVCFEVPTNHNRYSLDGTIS